MIWHPLVMAESERDLADLDRRLHAIWLRQFWIVVLLLVIAGLLALVVFGVVAVEVTPES